MSNQKCSADWGPFLAFEAVPLGRALVDESGVRFRAGSSDWVNEIESPSHVQDEVSRPELGLVLTFKKAADSIVHSIAFAFAINDREDLEIPN